jgi:hypothetical protein
MAVKYFIRFAVLFLALTLTASAQQFIAPVPNVYDPPYGMVAQLWNASTQTIYIDHIDASGLPEGTQVVSGGIYEFSFGYSHLEESQCRQVPWLTVDPVNGPQTSSDTPIRVSQQPCTPNGLAYGVPTGPNSWNYTPTNLFGLGTCWQLACSIDFPGGLPIPPNHGVTVYTAYYKDPSAFGWSGYAAVNFRGRK